MREVKTKGGEGAARFFDPATLTNFACFSALFAFICGMILGTDGVQPVLAACLAGAIIVFWTLFQMLRLQAVWMRYRVALSTPPRERTENQHRRIEHGFIEFFAYLAISLGALALCAYFASEQKPIGGLTLSVVGDEAEAHQLAGFVVAFFVSFAPLVSGFVRFTFEEAERTKRQIFYSDVVSDLSFWTTAVVVSGLVVLAWAAAGDMFTMEEDFGVFITGLVLSVFFAIILTPHVMRFLNNRHEQIVIAAPASNGLSLLHPGRIVSQIDSVLVRFVAPLSGATQCGPFVPHLLVIVVVLPLSALGYVLAAPWGLVPIVTAMLIALALGRRWAWVEEDRETASRLRTTQGKEIKIGFDNDLKDEALLGYASLFILVPLALHQLQGWTNSFVYDPQFSSNNAFFDWLRFFGAELAKAVPFVDWWEIYNVDIETPYNATLSDDPIAKHLTFAARAMVDLVIMAALFQAISLWQRSRTHNRLYDSGQLDTFDPFTEVNFFERGMIWDPLNRKFRPKDEFEKRVNLHVNRRRELNLSATPYSQKRLSELMTSPIRDVNEGANWMINEFGVLAGTPAQQLAQLRRRLRSVKFLNALQRDSESDRFYVREQKSELERVLLELERRPDLVTDVQVGDLVNILIAVRDLPDFTSAEVTAVKLFERQLTRRSLLALYNLVMEEEHRTSVAGSDLQAAIEYEFGSNSYLYTGLAPMRSKIYSAIETHGLSIKRESDRMEIVKFLDWMGRKKPEPYGIEGDRAKLSRERASSAATLISSGLRILAE